MENSCEQTKLVILDSGEEFFDDLFEQISFADRYILIKQFLWRNDKTGQTVAQKLLEAMERGVKVVILKDRIGAFHEYGEREGQSFFHDDLLNDSLTSVHSLSTVYAQSNLLFSKFYRNGVTPQQKNPLRDSIVEHPNATVIDGYKLYDHSKVIVIDGEVAYVGGIGFGDEFSASDEKWADYMVKIDDTSAVENLLRILATGFSSQNGPTSTRFHTGYSMSLEGTSLHDHVVDTIHNSRRELLIEMPFLGNPDYIKAIAACVRAGVKVCIILPKKAPSHHYRNLHFLKTLTNRVGTPENLDIVMSPSIVHGKSIVSDNTVALLGSHNLHMDSCVLEETILETRNQELIALMRARLMAVLASGEHEKFPPPWREIIVQSRLEYLSVKLQTLMSRLRAREIYRVRELCRQEIQKLID